MFNILGYHLNSIITSWEIHRRSKIKKWNITKPPISFLLKSNCLKLRNSIKKFIESCRWHLNNFKQEKKSNKQLGLPIGHDMEMTCGTREYDKFLLLTLNSNCIPPKHQIYMLPHWPWFHMAIQLYNWFLLWFNQSYFFDAERFFLGKSFSYICIIRKPKLSFLLLVIIMNVIVFIEYSTVHNNDKYLFI